MMTPPTAPSPPVPGSGSPSDIGSWEPIKYHFQYIPVHVALLHTGKVLAFGGTGNDETAPAPHPAELFDPVSGGIKSIVQDLGSDVFCAGHSFLADGKLLVAGGTYKYDGKFLGLPVPPFTGIERSFFFDPAAEVWTRVDDMANGRWYPTLITLADGRVISVAGLAKGFPWVFLRMVEVYSVQEGWQELKGASRWLPLYPRLHLLPDGKIFYAGSYNTHYTFPFTLRGFPTSTLDPATSTWITIGPPNKSEREEGTTVLLPLEPPDYTAKVILVGGGDTGGKNAIPDSEIIDLSVPAPQWRQIDPMKNARYYAYPVILPDKKILIVGGRGGEKGMPEMSSAMEYGMGGTTSLEVPQDPLAVRECEVFDPATEKWTTVASMNLDRLYHANALLLPDGRVMTCGSNPSRRVNELRIEIYDPPYLFRGPRPSIASAPSTISYAGSFEVKTPDAGNIQQVALIRSTATTHCVNTEQRYVGLQFAQKDPDTISATVPSNRNLAPPGYYMLFIVAAGVPSVAAWILLS